MAAKRKAAAPAGAEAGGTGGNGMAALVKELWQAAVTLRGSIEPADYKRYVLPIIFLRFLSLRYERRRDELAALISDKKSDYFGDKKALSDPDEYRSAGAFLVPEKARWENIVAEFAKSEGKRGGECFTPQSIFRTLVAMLEPTKGVVFDHCCGSGGMFVQSGAADGPTNCRDRRGGVRLRTERRARSRAIKAELRAACPTFGPVAKPDRWAHLSAYVSTQALSVR